MLFKPLGSKIILQPVVKEHSSGLIISAIDVNEAKVIAIGQDVKELKIDNIVRYDSSVVVKLDSLLICCEADVYCVVD